MSTYADSSEAVLWVDGDAFRGVADATAPADPFAAAPSAMDAYGAIEAGFTVTPTQEKKVFNNWNSKSGGDFFTYLGNTSTVIKFRVNQLSKAAVLTDLRGGSIAETSGGSGIFKWNLGDTEQFSLLIQLRSSVGSKKQALWIAKAELSVPAETVLNDEKLGGYDFEVTALAPADGSRAVIPFTNWNPLA